MLQGGRELAVRMERIDSVSLKKYCDSARNESTGSSVPPYNKKLIVKLEHIDSVSLKKYLDGSEKTKSTGMSIKKGDVERRIDSFAKVPMVVLERIDGDNNRRCGVKRKLLGSGSPTRKKDRVLRELRHERCKVCHQLVNGPQLHLYHEHPPGALEESLALIDSRLSLFTGDEEDIDEEDVRPQNKITQFSVYDEEGHLCPLDSCLIEEGAHLFFSGYLKAIYEDSSNPEGGVPAKDLGPITQWWLSGYDGGEKSIIGLSTDYAEYILMEPSPDYMYFMNAIHEKAFISKLVIEILVDEPTTTFPDLLEKLEESVVPDGMSKLTEDVLLRHAEFVCSQVVGFDAAEADDDDPLIAAPCMRTLIKLSGFSFSKRQTTDINAADEMVRKCKSKAKAKSPTKTTVTPLVQNVFEKFFNDQLDKRGNDIEGKRETGCGSCQVCQQPDCGVCISCMYTAKASPKGRPKKMCIMKKRCPQVAIQDADDLDSEDDDEQIKNRKSKSEDPEMYDTGEEEKYAPSPKRMRRYRRNILEEVKSQRRIEWLGKPLGCIHQKTFYSAAKLGDLLVNKGDCVMVEPKNPNDPLLLGQVVYMYELPSGEKKFHCCWFINGGETILAETSDATELFASDECEDGSLNFIIRKANVKFVSTPENWNTLGGDMLKQEPGQLDEEAFFCQKRYDPACCRFMDLHSTIQMHSNTDKLSHCPACEYVHHEENEELVITDSDVNTDCGQVVYGVVKWNKMMLYPGCAVFLMPNTFGFRRKIFMTTVDYTEKDVDEEMFPELYRKTENSTGTNTNTPEPFCIGYVNKIFSYSESEAASPRNVFIHLNKLYRPENTNMSASWCQKADINVVYWSDKELVVPLKKVVGKCYLAYKGNISIPLHEWSMQGPNRFYFSKAYNCESKCFEEPPVSATFVGHSLGIGPWSNEDGLADDGSWQTVKRKLKALDVFAGCGGLSEGLHQSGIAETLWAIEREEEAARAFSLNNRKCTVFTEDCNHLLKLVMAGKKVNEHDQKLPQKGDVELLCGGPPCQGFSGMNRYSSGQNFLLKNSLIASFLSYCDFYRPKFLVLENVRNFVAFQRNMVLKLTLRCLLKMGYQCTFGVLQAGNYGVAQTRHRVIILAAAPGEVLPKYPEPTHVFSPRVCRVIVTVDDKKYETNCKWLTSAPFRTITIQDAISDLPPINNGDQILEMKYGGEPESDFQRKMRVGCNGILRDHICREMTPLIAARMAHIPVTPGADWRDLPNIVVHLSDGTFTNKLIYTYDDKKSGRSSSGALRGVCICATGAGKRCSPMDKQNNTLIPWCLPHTGNRHNHWANLYGRLQWDGFFSTTITNPDPLGKQGRVLHPNQHRVVSVRECARSQGFPDYYRFYGTVLHKHRQIGNAVPPPMGAALGYEIRKSVGAVENRTLK